MKWYKYVALSALLCFFSNVSANEVLGGHISYECIGGNDYMVTLSVYVDCFAALDVGMIPPAPINFLPDASCVGFSVQSRLATVQSDVEISDLCALELPYSSCAGNGGFLPGTRLVTYAITTPITLDPSCTWTIYWSQRDYFENFQNTNVFDNQDDAYFYSIVDPALGCQNSISIDGAQEVPYGLIGDLVSHQLPVTSPSGNALNYTLMPPQVINLGTVSDFPGFDIIDMTISTAGLLEFTMTAEGKYVVSVLIEEVDGLGNVISTTLETMTFISRAPITTSPVITSDGALSTDGSGPSLNVLSNTEFEICTGDTLCLQFEVSHESNTPLFFSSDITGFEADATIVDLDCGLIPLSGSLACTEVCFPVTSAGDFTFNLEVQDGNCTGIPGSDDVDITVHIGQGASIDLISTNSTICAGDEIDFETNPLGFGLLEFSYSEQPASAAEPDTLIVTNFDPAVTPLTLQPSENTEYCVVSLIDGNGCAAEVDPTNTCFQVAVNPLLTTVGFGDNDTVCSGGIFSADLSLTGTAPYTISYTETPVSSGITSAPMNVVLNTGDFWDITPLASTKYNILSITDSAPVAPCTVNSTDSIILTVLEYTELTVTAPASLCEGEIIRLQLEFLNLVGPNFDIDYTITETGEIPLPTSITNIGISEVDGSGIYILTPPIPGIQSDYNFTIDNLIDDGNECTRINNPSSLNVALASPPTLNSTSDVIGTGACANSTVLLSTTVDPNYTYSWTSNESTILNVSNDNPVSINVVNQSAVDLLFEAYLQVDDGACIAYDTLRITVFPEPTSNASINGTTTVCFGDIVTLQGAGDGNLSWFDNGNLSDYTIANPTVLNTQQTDTFVLQIESLVNPGCFGYDSVFMEVNPEIIPTIDFDQNLCFGLCNGTISFTVAGGTGALTTNWTDQSGAAVNNLTNLCADQYTLSITDGVGCTRDSTIIMNELPEYFLTDVVFTDTICFAAATGTIDIDAIDAVEYVLQTTDTQTISLFDNLAPMTYTVSAINSFGCEADSMVTIEAYDQIVLSTNFSAEIICSGDPVTFEASAIGGSNDFTYFWLPANNEFNTNSNTVTLTPTSNVSVEVYTMDSQGCFSDTLQMQVSFPPPITIDFLLDTITICQGDIANLEAIASGGTGILSCTWTIPGGTDVNNCTTPVEPLSDTNYTVTVTDQCSEPASAVLTVIVNETPTPEFSVNSQSGCLPLEVQFTNSTAPNTSNNCTWNLGDDSLPITFCDNFVYTYTSPGTYVPTLTVTSSENCSATSSASGNITVHDYPSADFDWIPNPVTIVEPEVQFLNLTSGGSNYVWSAEGAFTATSPNPYFEFEPTSLASYNICLEAESPFGCKDTLCQLLVIEGVVIINIPNAFSPDGNGLNEVFQPVAVGISDENYKFQVWSRGGQLVFETNERGVPWDGSHSTGDYYSGNDVYTWTLEVQDSMSTDIQKFSGHVTILR